MSKKFRKNSSSKLIALILAKTIKVGVKEETVTRRDEQILSPNDRIVWTYKENKKHKVIEVTSVSYVTRIDKVDYTVIYYDNSHDGVMHRHIRTSVMDDSDAPILLSVKKRGNQNNLLSWAIKDIRTNWYYYRKKFYIRSKIKLDF